MELAEVSIIFPRENEHLVTIVLCLGEGVLLNSK